MYMNSAPHLLAEDRPEFERILDEALCRDYAVNAGGDMVVRGALWRVGIQHPLERDKVAKVVEATELAIATSGEYERGAHVLDPHTGEPPTGVLSDDRIVELLRGEGIEVARRTVAKYRDALNIPSSARRRREKMSELHGL